MVKFVSFAGFVEVHKNIDLLVSKSIFFVNFYNNNLSRISVKKNSINAVELFSPLLFSIVSIILITKTC